MHKINWDNEVENNMDNTCQITKHSRIFRLALPMSLPMSPPTPFQRDFVMHGVSQS